MNKTYKGTIMLSKVKDFKDWKNGFLGQKVKFKTKKASKYSNVGYFDLTIEMNPANQFEFNWARGSYSFLEEKVFPKFFTSFKEVTV